MTRGRTILLVTAVVVLGSAGLIAYAVQTSLHRIREAYAAWDTGTLLTEYMERNDDRWPKSWDDLVAIVPADPGRQVMFRGASAGDVGYARSLKERVAVDWAFNPARPGAQNPVTRADGEKFPMTWSAGEPNEMVRSYLSRRAATRPAVAP